MASTIKIVLFLSSKCYLCTSQMCLLLYSIFMFMQNFLLAVCSPSLCIPGQYLKSPDSSRQCSVFIGQTAIRDNWWMIAAIPMVLLDDSSHTIGSVVWPNGRSHTIGSVSCPNGRSHTIGSVGWPNGSSHTIGSVGWLNDSRKTTGSAGWPNDSRI